MTRRGDEGETDLLYGKRIPKTDARVEALGAIDELNTHLGLVRIDSDTELEEQVDWIQSHLVGLMGELAVLPEDRERYESDGMAQVTGDDIRTLEGWGKSIEEAGVKFEGWARPGASGQRLAAQIDVTRTVCRRAERRVLELGEGATTSDVRLFLNRLSDWLWLSARKVETAAQS